jgi:thiamine pyrophosphokinase
LDAIFCDLGSLRLPVKQYFTSLEKPTKVDHYPGQNLYDPDKAVSWVRSNYAPNIDIVILGGLSGRAGHGLRLVQYLFHPGPTCANGRVFFITSQNLLILLKPSHHQIRVQEGNRDMIKRDLGAIPIGKPSLITTKGLKQEKQLKITLGGKIIRNHVLPGVSTVEIETSNAVLFTSDIVNQDNR